MPAILIVDDNPIQAFTRRLILERAHFQIVLAEDGASALATLDTGEPVGMVITDHLMPEMSGPELVRRIRGWNVQIPVLVLSGLAEAETEYANFNVIFRMKPIQPEDLIGLARSVIFPALDQTA